MIGEPRMDMGSPKTPEQEMLKQIQVKIEEILGPNVTVDTNLNSEDKNLVEEAEEIKFPFSVIGEGEKTIYENMDALLHGPAINPSQQTTEFYNLSAHDLELKNIPQELIDKELEEDGVFSHSVTVYETDKGLLFKITGKDKEDVRGYTHLSELVEKLKELKAIYQLYSEDYGHAAYTKKVKITIDQHHAAKE